MTRRVRYAHTAQPSKVVSTAGPPRKTGWQVRQSVAEAVRQAVNDGAAESQNAFVERALIRELRELRRRRVYDAYAEASKDPEFLRDVKAVTRAFERTAGEGLAEKTE